MVNSMRQWMGNHNESNHIWNAAETTRLRQRKYICWNLLIKWLYLKMNSLFDEHEVILAVDENWELKWWWTFMWELHSQLNSQFSRWRFKNSRMFVLGFPERSTFFHTLEWLIFNFPKSFSRFINFLFHLKTN